MERTWKSHINRPTMAFLHPNPFYYGLVRMLLVNQKVRNEFSVHRCLVVAICTSIRLVRNATRLTKRCAINYRVHWCFVLRYYSSIRLAGALLVNEEVIKFRQNAIFHFFTFICIFSLFYFFVMYFSRFFFIFVRVLPF